MAHAKANESNFLGSSFLEAVPPTVFEGRVRERCVEGRGKLDYDRGGRHPKADADQELSMNSVQENRPPSPSKLKTWGRLTLGVLAALFVGIQFVPVEAMENPPSQPPLPEPPEVVAILKRACYDCHSHEVRWPWYSRIAPVSWLVASDVVEGRKGINFSEWPEDPEDRVFSREQSWESVESGEMPLWFYLPVHPEANLTEADKAVLKKWAETEVEEEDEDEGEEEEDAEPAQSAAPGDAKPADKGAKEAAEDEQEE